MNIVGNASDEIETGAEFMIALEKLEQSGVLVLSLEERLSKKTRGI
ncbi:MAG: hypothetical protein LBI29_02415 [Rickettsiales bacterium]|jgi:hypothetical protein|nr:hypothetical protein [Rickettsiales bacterium]